MPPIPSVSLGSYGQIQVTIATFLLGRELCQLFPVLHVTITHHLLILRHRSNHSLMHLVHPLLFHRVTTPVQSTLMTAESSIKWPNDDQAEWISSNPSGSSKIRATIFTQHNFYLRFDNNRFISLYSRFGTSLSNCQYYRFVFYLDSLLSFSLLSPFICSSCSIIFYNHFSVISCWSGWSARINYDELFDATHHLLEVDQSRKLDFNEVT